MKKIIKNSIKTICFALLVLGTLTMKCDMETKADELVNKIKYQISNGGVKAMVFPVVMYGCEN